MKGTSLVICYKDKTFCNSDCVNESCHRFFGDKQLESARAWWGDDTPPIAFADFSTRCEDYTKPTETA